MRIVVKNNYPVGNIGADQEYVVDFDNNNFEGYKSGDLICYVCPFYTVPLRLEIAIRADGTLVHRKWAWSEHGNSYLHTDEKPEDFTPTAEQIDTVNGLFSGRILYRGLKLAVGATVQKICPIDLKREESLTGKKIFIR